MPLTPQQRAAAVKRALSAIRSVKALERGALLEVRASLAEVRSDLFARLASGGRFEQANQFALLREVDRVAAEVERLLGTPIIGAQRAAEDLAAETFRKNLAAQGIEPSAVKPLIRIPEIVISQRENIGDLVAGASAQFKAALRADLRRTLLGGQTLGEFQSRIGRRLTSPGPFGAVLNRAEVIVRNETSNTFALAQEAQRQSVAEQGFGFTKTWITSRDPRVRPSHAAIDGATVKQGEDFDVGGWPAAYPKDPRLPPEESIQCRCMVVEQWSKSRPSGTGGRSINPVDAPPLAVVA